MRIAIFSDTFLPQVNGVSKTLGKMRDYMDAEGIEYKFFVPGEKAQDSQLENIISFNSINFFLYPECKIALPRYAEIKAGLDIFKPQIIHITTQFSLGLMGLKYARENNIPLVSSYHTDFPAYLKHYNFQFLEGALWNYLRWFHSFSSINFVPSKDTLEHLEKNGIKNLEVWGRGIDSPRFSTVFCRDEVRKQYGVNEESLLLYVGRLSPEKELDLLMDAAIQLNRIKVQFKLLIVGDGPSKQFYESKNIPNIIFTGYKSGEELQKIYAAADIFTFPSSTETYGNVILEAMISGLPVIAPFAGGIKENLIDMYNGLVFKTGDALDIAKTIERLGKNTHLKNQLGQNAKMHAQKKDWNSVFKNLFEQYQHIVDKYDTLDISLSA